MNKLKEFIQKKKLNSKFKQLGGGQRLGGPAQATQPSPSRAAVGPQQPQAQARRSDSEVIAAAAEKRVQGPKDPYAGLTPMQKMVKMQVKKELEEERLAQQMGTLSAGDQRQSPAEETDHASTVLFTCEIFDEDVALPKSQMLRAIEDALYQHMMEEPVSTSIWFIYTFNRDEQRTAAVDIIRKSGRATKCLRRRFQEEIREGERGDSSEYYLVMSSPSDKERAALRESLTALQEGREIVIRVFRDPHVFVIDPRHQLPKPDIPRDFFKRTVEEIKREQQRRTDELEQMMTLRTKQMREVDHTRKELGSNPYKYCYIRVRFPNNFLLQGIFNVYEKFAAVREFVARNLSIQHGTFTLAVSGTVANNQQQQLHEEENTLLDYGLAPSALIYFDWDSTTTASLQRNRQPIAYLTPELEASAQQLN
uniref:UBX domain-containing protein n=1 Tax=Globodera rostochiensis TaxID=31243 RepID=A0A914I4P0_GLORO